ncbi:LamG-like jellyroll fold domain-containing protein [Arthrobacter sp. SA17]
MTVEADVLVNASQSGSYFIYGFGNTDAAGVGNGYLFATGNSVYKTGIASGNWTTEQLANSTQALPRDSWKHLVYTLKGTVATVYLDGEKGRREPERHPEPRGHRPGQHHLELCRQVRLHSRQNPQRLPPRVRHLQPGAVGGGSNEYLGRQDGPGRCFPE